MGQWQNAAEVETKQIFNIEQLCVSFYLYNPLAASALYDHFLLTLQLISNI